MSETQAAIQTQAVSTTQNIRHDETILTDELKPAPEGMRYVGLCKDCRDFVELDEHLCCEPAGHDKSRLAAVFLLDQDEARPHLPSMNWGALLMTPLWAAGHGQIYLILLYPVWLFLDNTIYTVVHNPSVANALMALVCVGIMLAFMISYGRHANVIGYLRVAKDKTVEEYLQRERIWTIVMAIIAILFVVFATWYNLAIRPGLDA